VVVIGGPDIPGATAPAVEVAIEFEVGRR
jgi:hypothetical protein